MFYVGKMRIGGIVKREPSVPEGKATVEIQVKGCNFKCSYCKHYELAYNGFLDRTADISETIVISYLMRARQTHSTVIITGGEPTLYEDLPDFLSEIKALGLKVYVKTNGTNPLMLKKIIDKKLADHIFLAIKSDLTAADYSTVSGVLSDVYLESVLSSVSIVRDSGVSHSFCTRPLIGTITEEKLTELSSVLGGDEKVPNELVSELTKEYLQAN